MPELQSRLQAALADRYRIERELGQGGMATVYLAEDLKHHRKVAIKVLRPELAAVLGAERFLREIETTANLRHPHILPLFDSGVAQTYLFYVMPFVEGESLRDRLAREKQLSIEEALQIAREVADALSYAHGRQIVHRDIKPENILLESGHAVVADFGIARAIRAAGGTGLTETGMSVGTPAYMSPEQAAGEQDLDGRSDLCALACVLYEMLAGQPPFTGATAEILVRQHLTVDAPPITNYRPAVPATVAAALQRALAKAPADRFNPVAQFSEALRRPATEEVATSVTGPARRAASRGWIGIAATAVLLLAIIGVMARRSSSTPPVGSASVAVLPFVDLSPDRTNAYLGDGLAETLINALANSPGLSVAARTSAFVFRDKADDVREIGKQLVHLWSRSFDRGAADIFAVQDEVVRAVVTAPQGKLDAGTDTAMVAQGTRNPAAYDAYLLGRFYWNKRTSAATVRAADFFKQAIGADSAYAQAWTVLADSYVLFGPAEYAVPGIKQDSILRLAAAAARRAIELAPSLGEPHSSLGEILGYRDRWEEAGDAFRKGIELSPRYATGHQWYAYHLMAWNRWDEALREMERARELDPLSLVIVVSLATAYDAADQPDKATPLYAQAQALSPDHGLTMAFMFAHDMTLGRTNEAASDYRRLLLASGSDGSQAAAFERRLRDPAGRTAALREMAATGSPYRGIIAHRVLDGDDSTIAYVARLAKRPERDDVNSAGINCMLSPKLRSNPRMQDALVALGYPRAAGTGKPR